MLRRVRNKLRKIRYYSAARPESAWTRAGDIALIASLVIAGPANWVASQVSIETRPALAFSGRLGRMPDGSLMPYPDESKINVEPQAVGTPAGNFLFWAVDEHRGWPLTISITRRPAVMNLDVLAEAAARKNVILKKDDPLRAAFEQMLINDGRDEELAAFQLEQPVMRQQWWGWLAGMAAWWILLAFASSLAIGVMRFIAMRVAYRKSLAKHRLRSQNKCAACGYDLTGLEFHERCPECGELTW